MNQRCQFPDCLSIAGFRESGYPEDGLFGMVCEGHEDCPACMAGADVPENQQVLTCITCGGEHSTEDNGHTKLTFQVTGRLPDTVHVRLWEREMGGSPR